MFHRKVVCFFLLVVLAANAQSINVHGKVANKAAKPIANAIVTLAGKTLMDTTVADGMYAIVSTAVAQQAFVPKSEKISLNKGVLELSLPKSSPVKIEIFDVKGTLVKKEVVKNAQAGIYRLNISETAYSSNMLVIHASIGQNVTTFQYLPMNNGRFVKSATNSSSDRVGGSLAKVLAVNDTVKVTAPNYKPVAIAITSYDTLLNIALDTAGVDESVVAVNLDQEKQTIQGFGINAALMTGSIFPIDECFGTEGKDALGMSILRIGMNTNGEHRDVPSGWEKARDQYGAKIIGSCWSAPADWKTNKSENGGGHLLTNYYKQWAETIAKYAAKYKLYAMSVANEADFASCEVKPCTNHYASMTYTGKEMVAFVKEARKAFNQYAPGVKMIAPEASLWIHVWSNISPDGTVMPGAPEGGFHSTDPHKCGCFANEITEEAAAKCSEACKNGDGYDYGHWLWKDQEAWKAFDIMGVHEYETQVAHKWPDDVNGGVRDKEVWQTEMSGVMYWPEQGPSAHIENGVAVARWIQSALTIGEASAWCYWWYGAPYYQSDDNEGLALIKGSNQKTKRYYTYGNYSKYMRPGQKVVNITGTKTLPAKVLLTASKDAAGKVVIVAVNETTTAQSIPITITGGTAPASFKPIVTNKTVNWSEGSAVAVTGGVLTAQLEAMSVTTFVSQ